ncbi:DUF6090 family protein [Psychroserpens damuponensis]|uniref:DUF6090 family protein n=1 Tax=Psychroserpens damuponensis TaxID=943936 RepID=UPI00069418BD|nr:DUF6090 family protein [Psychroserpens damuponensis]
MIKFFRKIRYDLMEKNKTTQYFKYAIGEIVLVVIGILIALQINTWNENRKNSQYEQNYLQRILKDLHKDQTELEMHFNTDTLKLDAFTQIMRIQTTNSITSNQQAFLTASSKVQRTNWFEGNDVVFNEMKFSGKLALIASEELRESIQNYYKQVEEVIKQENTYIAIQTSAYYRLRDCMGDAFIYEASMAPRWNSNTNVVTHEDIIHFYDNLNDVQKKEVFKDFTILKANILYSNNVRATLDEKGKATIKIINDYLEKQK